MESLTTEEQSRKNSTGEREYNYEIWLKIIKEHSQFQTLDCNWVWMKKQQRYDLLQEVGFIHKLEGKIVAQTCESNL